jgi:hypothetical protein
VTAIVRVITPNEPKGDWTGARSQRQQSRGRLEGHAR